MTKTEIYKKYISDKEKMLCENEWKDYFYRDNYYHCPVCNYKTNNLKSICYHVPSKKYLKKIYDTYISKPNICECGNETRFMGLSKGYSKYCSEPCTWNDKRKRLIEIKNKRDSAWREMYNDKERWENRNKKAGKNISKSLKLYFDNETDIHKNIRLKKQSNTMIKLISEGKFKPKTNNVYNGKIIEINGQKYRSSWDAMFHILNPDLQYEGIVIPYKIDNKIRNYFVDFVDNKNKILYEIKPKIRHNDKKNIIKFEALKKYSEKNNFTYKIIDEIYILDNIDKLNLNELPELMIRRLKCFLKKKGLVQ